MTSVRDRLIGSWRLVAYETRDPAGHKGAPYAAAVGRLTYDDRGNMSGQVMRPGRARVEVGPGNAQSVRAAYIGYIAYFGSYEVAADGALITRHAGMPARALSETHSELAPASSRFELFGSRMKGAMKFAFLVAPAPQKSFEPSLGSASVMPLQM